MEQLHRVIAMENTKMSKTYNTDRRRAREEHEQFSGERYGNLRRQQAEQKLRRERIDRARRKRDSFNEED
jgi:hypothetical protein